MSNNISPWFSKKYRVTPESSKVLQELVFKDGGYFPEDSFLVVSENKKKNWSFIIVSGSGAIHFAKYLFEFHNSSVSIQDGTKQLEEYMEKMKEQHELVGCHIGEASKIVSMSGQSLRIKFIRNGKEEVLPGSYKDTVFVYLVDFDCYANIPTDKIYQAYKPKIETIIVDGVEYDKKKFDAAMKAMKEAEVK